MSLSFPFQPVLLHGPAPPTLPPDTTVRWRPLVPITIIAPDSGQDHQYNVALLDTGSEDTIFPIDIALALGIQLLPLGVVGYQIRWRGTPYPLRFGSILLRLTDGVETWTWPTVVGFVKVNMPYPMLGQTGVLQHMNATFHGDSQQITLDPAPSFPGTVT